MEKFKRDIIIGISVALIAGVIVLFIEYNVFVPNTGSDRNSSSIPNSAVIVEQSRVKVPANVYWHDTDIKVEKGDWLQFIAKGSWWSGISVTDPEGDKDLPRSSCGECPVPEGNLGELVGKVGLGHPFRIGKSAEKDIDQQGNLFLAMNENTGPCKEGRRGSCYDDNNGALEVRVTVRRIK